MTRRSLIQWVLLILGIHPLGLVGCASRRAANGTLSPLLSVPDPTAALSGAELEGLVAFGEVLVEGRTLSPAERTYLVEHIEARMKRSPEDISLYRTAVSTLDRLAGRRFASLEVHEQAELIARHSLAGRRARPAEDPGPFPTETRVLRTRVVPDLIGGYYASPAGWAVVGYDSFPGRCGDLTHYTRPES